MPLGLFPTMYFDITLLEVTDKSDLMERLAGRYWGHQKTKEKTETVTHMFMNHLQHAVHLFYLIVNSQETRMPQQVLKFDLVG